MIDPVFLESFAGGPRFALRVAPDEGVALRGSILCVQPFGDEATLARRVLAAQARRLAAHGWSTLIVDLYGAGDSAGETGEATLAAWRADLLAAASAAREGVPGPFVLWGTRMGALLACELLQALDSIVTAAVFWQPAPTGAGLIEPLRKLSKVGAIARGTAAVGAAGAGATEADAARSDEHAHVDLGGYRLRPDLIDGLSALAMDPTVVGRRGVACPVLMLGIQRVLRPNAMAPLWLADLAQRWLDAGHLASLRTVQGEPFWASLEPSEPVAAFEATEAFLAEAARR